MVPWAKYKDKYLGTIGLMGYILNFSYSHHMCTMGGVVTTDDDNELYEYMLAIRAHGWTRNLARRKFHLRKKTLSIEL